MFMHIACKNRSEIHSLGGGKDKSLRKNEKYGVYNMAIVCWHIWIKMSSGNRWVYTINVHKIKLSI